MAEQAELAFNAYDFEADENWRTYEGNLNSPTAALTPALVQKFKRKYFQKNVDKNLVITKSSPPADAPSSSAAHPDPGEAQESRSSAAEQSPPQPRPPRPAAAPAAPAAAPTVMEVVKSHILSTQLFQFAANLYFVVSFIQFMMPFGDPELSAAHYQQAILAALFTYVVSLGRVAWPIQFSREWLARVAADQNAHYSLYCLSAMSLRPMALAVLSLLLFVPYNIANYLAGVLPTLLPALNRRFVPLHAKLNAVAAPVLGIVAQLEICLAIMLTVFVFLGQSTLLSVFMAWQFLRLRYQYSMYTRLVFTEMDTKINSVLAGRFVPGVLRWLYGKLRALMASFVVRQ